MSSRRQWRAWLSKHHAAEGEFWLVFYKKHTGKAGLVYEDAVQEALCFGWIDGIIKRIDDEKHMIRFTPRRKNSIWSPTNKKRVARLMASGQMTDAGLAKIEEAKRDGQWDRADLPTPEPDVPLELTKALAGSKKAQRNFANLAPSYRKQFIGWITTAKRDATRRKRVNEALRLLKEDKKLGMK
ncbi:MAG: YdeI/OmpD-associated family protein [Planctomycetota bacterium]